MFTSVEVYNIFDKIQPSFIIKILSKLELEGNFLNLIQGIYEKCTANIILNRRRLNVFLLRLVIRCLLPLLFFNIVPEVIATVITQIQKIKRI